MALSVRDTMNFVPVGRLKAAVITAPCLEDTVFNSVMQVDGFGFFLCGQPPHDRTACEQAATMLFTSLSLFKAGTLASCSIVMVDMGASQLYIKE